MKKTMKQHSFLIRLKSLSFVCGIAMTFASCANDDLAQNGTTSTNDKGLTAFSTGTLATRTSMKEDGTFYWEAGDKIWVKDDNGAWQQSSNAPTGKTTSFKFMVPGKYTNHASYDVYYPGKSGNKDKVIISISQSQTTPNTTVHFGVSGDCGMASASRIGTNNQFKFTLDHKAAYLRFLPHTNDPVLHDCYLTKVELSSDNDIAATYTLDKTTGKLTGTGTGKKIDLTTKGSGAYHNGFPLTNTSASASTNGAYMVIKPGTHTLRIRYWVKDIVSNVEGTITKFMSSKTFDQNKYYDITADLKVKNYDGDHYYMWDAKQQLWLGYEWTHKNPAWQPTIPHYYPGSTTSSFYPQNGSDNRWYNTGSSAGRFDATQSCAGTPNVNEISWYIMKGNPHYDGDELWATMGHLYQGGLWLLKHDKIVGYSKEKGYDGADWRPTNNRSLNLTHIPYDIPSAADASNYFYLPALGNYLSSGQYNNLFKDGLGAYWTSSAISGDSDWAYSFQYTINSVELVKTRRNQGLRVQAFE